MLYSPLASRSAHFVHCSFYPGEMNAQRPFQSADSESHLNSRRPESDFVLGPIYLTASPAVWTASVAFHSQYWDVTRRLLLRDKLRRSHFTCMEVVCGSKTDVRKHGWNLDFPCRNSRDGSYQFYLFAYWFIDLFIHFERGRKSSPKTPTTPETCKAAHTPTCTQ